MVCCDSVFSPQRVSLHSSAVLEVRMVVNPWRSRNSDLFAALSHKNRSSLPQEVDARSQPTSEVRLPERVDGFMIATDKYCKHSWLFFSFIIVLKGSHLLVFFRAVHIVEIGVVSDRLEVSAYDQQIKLFLEFIFDSGDVRVDCIEFAMQTSFNCDLNNVLFTLIVYYISNMDISSQSLIFVSEYLLQVQRYERSLVGIQMMTGLGLSTIGEVYFFMSEVVYGNLKVSWIEARNNLSDGELSSDVSVVIGQQLVKSFVERRAVPIHSIVHCVFNGRVPLGLRQRIVVPNNVANRVTVLETSELALSIANAKNQVTCPFGGLHSVDRFFKSFIPLKNVSEDEGEGISESAFFTKSGIRIADSDFRDSQLIFVDSWKHTDPSSKRNIEPGVSVLGTAGVIDNNYRVFVERSVQVLCY